VNPVTSVCGGPDKVVCENIKGDPSGLPCCGCEGPCTKDGREKRLKSIRAWVEAAPSALVSPEIVFLLDHVKMLQKKSAILESRAFADMDPEVEADIGKLLKALWQYSDTGDYGTISLKELLAMAVRCRV